MRIFSGLGMVVLIALVSVVPTRAADPVVLWSDGFETGNLSAWSGADGLWKTTGSVTAAHTGNFGADIFGPSAAGGDHLTVLVPSPGRENLVLSYWWKIRVSVEEGKFVALEYTPDAGANWIQLVAHSGEAGDWTQSSIDLPAGADNNPDFGFRLRSTLVNGISSDRMHFDDFVLISIPEPASLIILLAGIAIIGFHRR